MNHSDIQRRMADYLDGELSLEGRALFDAHLDQCDGCSRELAEMRETVRLLRTLPSPEPPADFVANVMQRIEMGEGKPGWFARFVDQLGRVFVPRIVIPATAVAAALTLSVMSGDLDLGSLDMRARPAQIDVARTQPEFAAQEPVSQVVRPPVQVAVTPVRARNAGIEGVRVANPAPPLRYGNQTGAGSFLYRVATDPLGPMERQARDNDLGTEVFFMSRSPRVGPYLGASAAPSIALGGGERLAGGAITPGAALMRGLSPVAVSHFDPVPAVGDQTLSQKEQRNRELDLRLEILTKDPTGFAQKQGQVTLAEQELWFRELAARAEELGVVERVVAALQGSGDAGSLNLARQFELAVEHNHKNALAAADAKAESK